MSVRQEQSRYAALRWRGQSSPTANLSAVTSSHDDLRDLAHRLSYVGGLLIGASGYSDVNGGVEVRVDGEMPVEAMAAQSNATPSIYGLRRT